MQSDSLTVPVSHDRDHHAAGTADARFLRPGQPAPTPAPLTNNLAARRRPNGGNDLSKREIIDFYRRVAQEIHSLIPPPFPSGNLHRYRSGPTPAGEKESRQTKPTRGKELR